ncbi:MAG: hypothetical protein A2X23_06035 [Chloroflexi bacterium GWC2_73_18]|nr:MAG: hypothetical protein A2X23_06035 [Chloroflexi bacterium GWC2_73_18]
MPFVAPLALLGLLFVPLIIAFYLLKLRRDERRVSSTYLWSQLVHDVEANAPWQRLRRSLLLLLQLLLVIALALLAARPFLERPAGLARDLVLVIDASASMAATDELPTRLEAAKAKALAALDALPTDGKVSLIVAAETARVVANESTDRGRLARAIREIAQSSASGDLTDALKLAGKLAARARGAEVLLVTDAAIAKAPEVRIEAPIRVLTVGRDRANQAIAALAVRSDPSGVTRSVFLRVENYDTREALRRIEILADGTLIDTREIFLDPLSRADIVIDDLPVGTRVVEARLAGPAGTGGAVATGGPAGAEADRLALDDAAWAILPEARLRRILLVGEGNAYLQAALTLLPDVELYGATPADYPKTTGKELFDLVIFDGWLPSELPRKPILAIAPPGTSPLGAVVGTLRNPAIGELDPDEPLLDHVDLTTVHVAAARRITLPGWARTVIPGPGEAPLLYAGEREGLRTAVLAFDLHASDLPLQVAFPVLVANVTGELTGATAEPVGARPPGAPVELPLPPEATGLRVTLPDGKTVDVAPGASGAASVTFAQTSLLGVYRAEPILPPGASPSPGTTATPPPTASPTPSGSPGASPSPGVSPGLPPTPAGPILFAVDLFDPAESNIAPGNGAALEALGGTAAGPGAEAGTTRDEIWLPLLLLALLLLAIEWAVYERDGLLRLRRAARDRLAGLRTAAARGPRRGV